ncbi:hypothetical protein SB783_05265 [Paraburkholderia sp. SIMBA_009]
MRKIVFDSNIYDLLEEDQETTSLVRRTILAGSISVLMPRQVAQELRRRPNGLPDLFPVVHTGHAVARAGLMRAGDFLGRGKVFDKHKGNSTKDADAFIVDVAAMAADWFVSEDRRCIARFPKALRCVPLSYADFSAMLRTQTN